jgi:hypothetical protein
MSFKLKPTSEWLFLNKSYKLLLFIAFLILAGYMFLYTIQSLQLNSSKEAVLKSESYPILDETSVLLQKLKDADKTSNFKYSVWPSFMNQKDFKLLEKIDQNFFINECCEAKIDRSRMSIENMEEIVRLWSSTKNNECRSFFKLFSLVYDMKFKQNHLSLATEFAAKVSKMLGYNPQLMKLVYDQV